MRQLLVLLPLALAGCRQAAEPVVIGHPVPLSGPDQAAGQLELMAVRLAVEAANAKDVPGYTRPVRALHARPGERVQATE